MDVSERILVFRFGEIGFALPLDYLLEIREGVRVSVPPDEGPENTQILFRDEPIPLRDFRSDLGLPSENLLDTCVVLHGESMPWALSVEKVDGIYSAADAELCGLPPLVVERTRPWYDHVLLFRGEPLVWCPVDVWESLEVSRPECV